MTPAVPGHMWCRSAGQLHITFFCSLLSLSFLSSSCASVAVHDGTVEVQAMLSPPIIQQSSFHLLQLFCWVVFTRLCQSSVCFASLFPPAYLPCLVPVTRGARFRVSSGFPCTITSSITHYKGKQEHTGVCTPLKFRVTRAFPLISSKTANHNSTLTCPLHLWMAG